MILFEVGEPSPKVIFRSMSFKSMREDINLSNKARKMVHIREKALKLRIAKRYNSSVIPRKFKEGDLVQQRTNIGLPTLSQGKLASN